MHFTTRLRTFHYFYSKAPSSLQLGANYFVNETEVGKVSPNQKISQNRHLLPESR
jgi:hypothetical protein